ncbi:MAG: Uncharacterised protein [Flavobacterium sp. SCGC AAA160-P02]|nr:MAG: Uncharacterised protein [Flavobacterium sp. SCGC AAA160-P02]
MRLLLSTVFLILFSIISFAQPQPYKSTIQTDDKTFISLYIEQNDELMKHNSWKMIFPNITVTEENLYFCIDQEACNFNTYYKYLDDYASKYPKLVGSLWPPAMPGKGVFGKCFYETEFKNAFTMSCNCSFDWQVNQDKKHNAFLGVDEGNKTITPYICENVAIAGDAAGGPGTVTAHYPCNIDYGLFDEGAGTFHYEIYLPSTMKHFVFRNATGTITANVYYHPATTKVTYLNSEGSPSINFIKTDPSKLPSCN